MKKENNQLVLRKDDYSLLLSYLKGGFRKSAFDRRNAEDLKAELKKAKLVNENDFPHDVVRLNSTVRIKADGKDEVMELVLITPDKANIKENKISVMAPIGTALIGFQKGQRVKWRVPAGKKSFTILEVINEMEITTLTCTCGYQIQDKLETKPGDIRGPSRLCLFSAKYPVEGIPLAFQLSYLQTKTNEKALFPAVCLHFHYCILPGCNYTV